MRRSAGATTPRLVLEEGLIVEQQACQMTLTCDHRAADGAAAADFLQTLRRRLQGL